MFDFSHRVEALPNGRHCARIPAKTIFDAVFLGSASQCGPLPGLKANAEAQRVTAGQAPHLPALDQPDQVQLWYAPQLDWSAADRDINVMKSVRRHPRNRQQVQSQAGGKRIVKEIVIEQSTNFCASNLELGSIPRPSSSTSWAAVAGRSTTMSFRPSPPTVRSSSPLCTKVMSGLCWC